MELPFLFSELSRPILKASALALTIQAVAQFSGANAVSAYAVHMCESVGFVTEPYLPAVAIAIFRIAGSLLSLFVLRFKPLSTDEFFLLNVLASRSGVDAIFFLLFQYQTKLLMWGESVEKVLNFILRTIITLNKEFFGHQQNQNYFGVNFQNTALCVTK